MSPYCPTCLAVMAGEERRCPLDGRFLHRRCCRGCGQELYPRELHCAHCGKASRDPVESLLLPPQATPRRQFGALLLDYLSLGMLIVITIWPFNVLLGLVLVAPLGLLYRAAGRSGGRQTFGQAVFHLATVDRKAGPASFVAALRRCCWELCCLPLLLAGSDRAEALLEGKSDTYEVTFA